MTDRILVVTPPDDVLLSGIRILHIDLNEQQSQTVSTTLLEFQSNHSVINYVWKTGNSIDYLLDKIPKCDAVIFNADSDINNQMIMGWIAAQSNSYYFGNLKDLHKANDRVIYSIVDLKKLLEKISKKHG